MSIFELHFGNSLRHIKNSTHFMELKRNLSSHIMSLNVKLFNKVLILKLRGKWCFPEEHYQVLIFCVQTIPLQPWPDVLDCLENNV